MNRQMSKVLGTVALAGWTISTLAGPIDPTNPGTRLPSPVDPKATHTLKTCADPALENVVVKNITRRTDGGYDFVLTGAVRNIGWSNYDSAARQQTVNVYRANQGSGSPELVRTQAFEDLRAGSGLAIRYRVLGWRLGNEFPPGYVLQISYDPDIAIDGNTANDDCQTSNNRKAISGADINRQLEASER